MFNKRYIKHLEAQIATLTIERDTAIARSEAAVNSLLLHIGAPTIDIRQVEAKLPDQPRRQVPSMYRRAKEAAARIVEKVA